MLQRNQQGKAERHYARSELAQVGQGRGFAGHDAGRDPVDHHDGEMLPARPCVQAMGAALRPQVQHPRMGLALAPARRRAIGAEVGLARCAGPSCPLPRRPVAAPPGNQRRRSAGPNARWRA